MSQKDLTQVYTSNRLDAWRYGKARKLNDRQQQKHACMLREAYVSLILSEAPIVYAEEKNASAEKKQKKCPMA